MKIFGVEFPPKTLKQKREEAKEPTPEPGVKSRLVETDRGVMLRFDLDNGPLDFSADDTIPIPLEGGGRLNVTAAQYAEHFAPEPADDEQRQLLARFCE